MYECQSVECTYISPVSIYSGMLVACSMQCAIMVSLPIAGGTILVSNYGESPLTLVGLMYPVIALHAWLSSVFSRSACWILIILNLHMQRPSCI